MNDDDDDAWQVSLVCCSVSCSKTLHTGRTSKDLFSLSAREMLTDYGWLTGLNWEKGWSEWDCLTYCPEHIEEGAQTLMENDAADQ